MRSDDIAISVRNLTKTYRLFGHPGDRIKQFFSLGLKQYHREFTALKDVSFDIKKGETVGIIGRNGSGKSTLLQLICGILKPTAGTVQVNGRISALLELGAGFNPEFTGRENVYFQGALMGFTKAQMDERFDDIAAFADIGEFIDQPVRIYSSGMFVRLAFSTAISADPDILVVDEALSVGDAPFQARCFKRINAIRDNGAVVLLVSHALEQIAHFCNRALWLDKGGLLADSTPAEALALYVEHLQGAPTGIVTSGAVGKPEVTMPSADAEPFSQRPAYNPVETRWGDRSATIVDFVIKQNGQMNLATLVPGLVTELHLHIHFHSDLGKPIYGLTIKSPAGSILFGTNSKNIVGSCGIPAQKIGDRLTVCFFFKPFLDAGDYLISVGVVSETDSGIVPHDRRYDSIVLRVAHPISPNGEIAMNPTFKIIG